LPDGFEALARLAGARTGQQRVVEILPKLFMLSQVNDGRRLLASFIHHESDSAHGNNLAEKRAEVNFNLTVTCCDEREHGGRHKGAKRKMRGQIFQCLELPHLGIVVGDTMK
jgi:hypothetical protein